LDDEFLLLSGGSSAGLRGTYPSYFMIFEMHIGAYPASKANS